MFLLKFLCKVSGERFFCSTRVEKCHERIYQFFPNVQLYLNDCKRLEKTINEHIQANESAFADYLKMLIIELEDALRERSHKIAENQNNIQRDWSKIDCYNARLLKEEWGLIKPSEIDYSGQIAFLGEQIRIETDAVNEKIVLNKKDLYKLQQLEELHSFVTLNPLKIRCKISYSRSTKTYDCFLKIV